MVANAAERSLDVQYYIWHADQTGYLLAAQEQSLQKLSTPGRALFDNPIVKKTPPSDPVTRSGDKKIDFAAQEAEFQRASTPGRALVNNPIDKKTPPTKSSAR